MSLYLNRPQDFGQVLLNIGNNFNRPQGIGNGGISPGVDSEIFDDAGIQGSMIFDDGIETGFILIKEA